MNLPLKVAYTEKGEGYGGDAGITDASGRWIAAMMDYEEDAQEIVNAQDYAANHTAKQP